MFFRDRFIFGSCCKLPEPEMDAVIAENDDWEEQVNNLPLDQVGKLICSTQNGYFTGVWEKTRRIYGA